MSLKAIVVGGGVGGLTAAIALRQAGIDTVVFERAAQLRPVGAGLHLWTNAFLALQQIGLAEAVAATGTVVERSQYLTAEGRLLAEWKTGELGRRLGAPTVGVTRADLHRELMAALGKDSTIAAAEFTGFAQDGSGVTVRFRDGREERCDLLIGADGVRSAVRAQLLGSAEPRYAGYSAWRAITAFEHPALPRGNFALYWGRGARLICYRVGGGLMYWLALWRAPAGGRDPEGGRRAAALARYRHFAAPVPALIEATDEAAIVRTDIVDRAPISRWGEGRVTLLGDAAHPMTPNQAQGACQAIEDGVSLARCVREAAEVPAALRDYEGRRRARAAYFVRLSRFSGWWGSWESPAACAVRDAILGPMMRGPALWSFSRDIAHRA